VAIVACAPLDPVGPVGIGARPGEDAGATPADAAVRGSSPIPADFRARFTKLNAARFLSKGHLYDRFAVDLWANESGKDAYDGKLDVVPAGAMIVKEHFDRTTMGDRPGPLMAMEKKEKGYDADHGDWRYLVVSARGEVVTDGKPDKCVGCHREAPRDYLFRAAE
jgi:hypothetical protein